MCKFDLVSCKAFIKYWWRRDQKNHNVWEALVTLGNWGSGVEKSNLREETPLVKASRSLHFTLLGDTRLNQFFNESWLVIKREARQQHWGGVTENSRLSSTSQQGIYVVQMNENETARAHKQGAFQLNQAWAVVADETIRETATVNQPLPWSSPRWRSKKEQILIKEWALDRGDDGPVW